MALHDFSPFSYLLHFSPIALIFHENIKSLLQFLFPYFWNFWNVLTGLSHLSHILMFLMFDGRGIEGNAK